MVFIIIWFGQFVSLIGSSLTGFALGVWVYQRTGSATQFALISLFNVLPGILMSTLAGVFIDRWDRRKAMLICDLGSGLCTLAVALLLIAGRLEIWCIYLSVATNSLFNAFRLPAFSAMTTLLIPKRHYGRAGGMVQAAMAAAQIISPVIAGAIIAAIQIQGVLLIDFASFLFAFAMLLIVRTPTLKAEDQNSAAKGSLLREALNGWGYISATPGLSALLIFFAVSNFSFGIVTVLLTPLILSFTTVKELGAILSIGGSGLLIGSLVMSIWGGPKRRIYGIIGFALLQGAFLFLSGLAPSIPLIACAAFFFLFCISIINGCSQAIWQSKVAPELQGRVFAMRNMISWSALPLAYLISGPLADRVFKPLLVEGGPLAGSVGKIIGVGPGRGIGLLFIIIGAVLALSAYAIFQYTNLRYLEDELPDAIAVTRPPDLQYADINQSPRD